MTTWKIPSSTLQVQVRGEFHFLFLSEGYFDFRKGRLVVIFESIVKY